jgi:hypothetical protein
MNTATYKWLFVGDVLLAVIGDGQVSDADWDAFIRDIKATPFTKFLGATIGAAAVGSAQRKQANELISQRKVAVALVTDQAIVRGMATAAAWFGVDVKAFSWADARSATKYLASKNVQQEERLYKELLRLKVTCA